MEIINWLQSFVYFLYLISNDLRSNACFEVSYKSHKFNNSLKVNLERLQSAKLSTKTPRVSQRYNSTLKHKILLKRMRYENES